MMTNSSSSVHLLKDKRFYPFFWVQFLGAMNDNLFKSALVILIAFRSLTVFGVAPAQMVALCGGIFILPFFLFSPLAGQLADKHNKARIAVILKLIEVILMLLAGYAFTEGKPELLVILLFFMGTQSAFFGPIKYSIMPQLLERDELVNGTALVEFGTFSAILLGTTIGGLLIGFHKGVIYVAVTLVALASAGWISSLLIQQTEAKEPNLKIDLLPFAPVFESFLHMRKDPSVFWSVVAISWFWFYGAALLSVLPVYGKTTLQGNEHVVTLLLALFTLGIGIGSILCGKLSKGKLEPGFVPLGAIGITIFSADLFFCGKPYEIESVLTLSAFLFKSGGWRVIFDFLMLSISGGLFIVPLYTLLQLRTEDSDRSRVIAGNNVLNAFFMVFAALFIAWLFSKKLSEPGIFGVLALLNLIVVAFIFYCLPEFHQRFVTAFHRTTEKK